MDAPRRSSGRTSSTFRRKLPRRRLRPFPRTAFDPLRSPHAMEAADASPLSARLDAGDPGNLRRRVRFRLLRKRPSCDTRPRSMAILPADCVRILGRLAVGECWCARNPPPEAHRRSRRRPTSNLRMVSCPRPTTTRLWPGPPHNPYCKAGATCPPLRPPEHSTAPKRASWGRTRRLFFLVRLVHRQSPAVDAWLSAAPRAAVQGRRRKSREKNGGQPTP